MKVNVWSIVFASQAGEKPILELGQKFELTVDSEDVEQLSVMDAAKIFKNGYKKVNIRGKAFWLRYKNQIFFITKIKNDFKIYTLE